MVGRFRGRRPDHRDEHHRAHRCRLDHRDEHHRDHRDEHHRGHRLGAARTRRDEHHRDHPQDEGRTRRDVRHRDRHQREERNWCHLDDRQHLGGRYLGAAGLPCPWQTLADQGVAEFDVAVHPGAYREGVLHQDGAPARRPVDAARWVVALSELSAATHEQPSAAWDEPVRSADDWKSSDVPALPSRTQLEVVSPAPRLRPAQWSGLAQERALGQQLAPERPLVATVPQSTRQQQTALERVRRELL